MKYTLTTLIAAFAFVSMGSTVALSQEEEPPRFVPVEVFGCNYLKGKSYTDLEKVIDRWNKWMDENSKSSYTAWTLQPHYYNRGAYEMDVGWIGVWADGNDMGASEQQTIFGEGAAMNAEFYKVVECAMHSSSASVNVKMPAEWPNETSVTIFSDCTVAEGKTLADAFAMEQAWGAHMESLGSKAGGWLWFPGWGLGDIEYDYKRVIGHPDYPSAGADFESFTNGQGFVKAGEIFGGNVVCDSPRVYATRLVRNGGVAPR